MTGFNRLANEKSPYLLQHAHNPVDWYPWGQEAFDKARAEDKPIFLSVGYSTCHWCHVMERESFENEAIAGLLNSDYVSIKVDREERPDVDRVYMTFVQATTGGGGWPMSVWLTPELEPFFGGTYFPPEDRMGHPGLPSVLRQISAAWRSERGQIVESARDVVRQLAEHIAVEPAGGPGVDLGILDSGFYAFRRSFDSRLGGFGGAPKFPRPTVLSFLLRYWARTKNEEALEMSLLTMREMAKGGMHDHLGGGFHRYSVDERWFVPHFEKMLYDQAQLATSYLEAFQITGDPQYAETARRTLNYVLRDMTSPEGGFYSAEDADSPVDSAHLEIKGEGAFYIWKDEEIGAILRAPVADWVRYRYGIETEGNVHNDPHREFAGRNILYQAHTVEETAREFERQIDEVRSGLLQADRILFETREKRSRPQRDDKIITAWNGLMISAFALGGAVLGDAAYADAAREAARFLLSRLYDPASGALLRRYRDGDAAVPGFLEDYALLAQGLLDLYETQFDYEHLETAVRLTERQSGLFEDRQRGGFFGSAASPDLVMRVKEDYDGAEPSGNSVAIANLLRLARMTGRQEFQGSAERALAAFAPRLAAAPSALPRMLAACEFLMSEPQEIVIAGERQSPDTTAMLKALFPRFSPNRVTLLLDSPETRSKLAEGVPGIAFMERRDGRATAYVCRNFACQAPVTGAEDFARLIQ